MHERSIRYVIEEFQELKEDVKKGEKLEERLKKTVDGVDTRIRNKFSDLFSFNAEEILRELKSLCIKQYPTKKDIITSLIDKELEELKDWYESNIRSDSNSEYER